MSQSYWKQSLNYLLRPIDVIKSFSMASLSRDVQASITVAFVLLPQAMAYAAIADLSPEIGLIAGIVACLISPLWSSGPRLQTGPTSPASLLTIASISSVASAASSNYSKLVALMTAGGGVFRILFSFLRLGRFVEIISESVILAFTSGAAFIIAFGQFRHLLGIRVSGEATLIGTVATLWPNLSEFVFSTFLLGVSAFILLEFLSALSKRIPAALLVLGCSIVTLYFSSSLQTSIQTIGKLPLLAPSMLDFSVVNRSHLLPLVFGSLSLAVIGVIEAVAISKALRESSDERFDADQEFIAQGIANIGVGFAGGYPVSGSFTRSALNKHLGGQTALSHILCGIFVLIVSLIFAPLSAYLPRATLAAIVISTAIRLVKFRRIIEVAKASKVEALVMAATFIAAIIFPLHYSVFVGVTVSIAVNWMKR